MIGRESYSETLIWGFLRRYEQLSEILLTSQNSFSTPEGRLFLAAFIHGQIFTMMWARPILNQLIFDYRCFDDMDGRPPLVDLEMTSKTWLTGATLGDTPCSSGGHTGVWTVLCNKEECTVNNVLSLQIPSSTSHPVTPRLLESRDGLWELFQN